MARKSRKNLMPQAAAQEAVQQNEKELLRTAAYARLSVENGGHETEDSLHTQILQIHNYIRENPELTLTDTYADNGFTGTRFDRPEFERMMQDVRTGKIQCIVVKDLSRFGRDYAEFVFTGTFHGAVFSILNRRQFKVYLTNESRIKKVTALLEELGIQNRKMDSKFEFDLESMKNEINYDAVYRVINEKRQSSKQYLKDAIGMAKQ